MIKSKKWLLAVKLFLGAVMLFVVFIVWFVRAWAEFLLEEDLAKAAGNGDMGTVKFLVNIGVDVDGKNADAGLPPLLEARINGHDDIVKYLLDHHADPDPPHWP